MHETCTYTCVIELLKVEIYNSFWKTDSTCTWLFCTFCIFPLKFYNYSLSSCVILNTNCIQLWMAINPAACYHSHEQQHMKKVALNQIGSIQSGKKISYTCIFICMKTGYLLQYLLILYLCFMILFGENIINRTSRKSQKKRN